MTYEYMLVYANRTGFTRSFVERDRPMTRQDVLDLEEDIRVKYPEAIMIGFFELSSEAES